MRSWGVRPRGPGWLAGARSLHHGGVRLHGAGLASALGAWHQGRPLRAMQSGPDPEGTPESWSITMFTEEVVRGGMAFAVSGVMRKLEAEIRKAGGLSDWQIVSPGTKTASGLLCNVVLKDV